MVVGDVTFEDLVGALHACQAEQRREVNPNVYGVAEVQRKARGKDAEYVENSPESRFDIAYKAVMQCALLTMLMQGFRPSTNEPGHRRG